MLEKFIVGGYRGLQDLEFTNLKKINILVGPNNCGKTSLLLESKKFVSLRSQ